MWTSLERLRPDHDLGSFTCGEDGLDRWLQEAALGVQAEGLSAVHLCVRDDQLIRGFIGMSFTTVRDRRRNATPAILLGKLGLHQELHGTGKGTLLLYEAFKTACRISEYGGGSHLIVDVPNPLKRGYYERHGFQPLSTGGTRMRMKMSTVRAAVEQLG